MNKIDDFVFALPILIRKMLVAMILLSGLLAVIVVAVGCLSLAAYVTAHVNGMLGIFVGLICLSVVLTLAYEIAEYVAEHIEDNWF